MRRSRVRVTQAAPVLPIAGPCGRAAANPLVHSRHGQLFLASFIVFEETFAQQLHAHGLLGVPEGSLHHKPNRTWTTLDGLIKSIWCSMDHGGRPDGQDLQRIEQFEPVRSYVQKGIWNLASLDRVDLPNTKAPPVPARLA